MQNPDLDRQYWDGVFGRLDPSQEGAPRADHWLETLQAQTEFRLGGRALEIGCGLGHDTSLLLAAGCQVTAMDFTWVALRKLVVALPSMDFVCCRLPSPLPFRSCVFDLVVAGLSLHYYRWADTMAIVGEVRRVLQPGGQFVLRVNSTEDVNHGYGRGREIEPGLFLVGGRTKRFFDQADCGRLLAEGWYLGALLPLLEHRYGDPKPTWAAVAERIG